jgi:hypothetical protein
MCSPLFFICWTPVDMTRDISGTFYAFGYAGKSDTGAFRQTTGNSDRIGTTGSGAGYQVHDFIASRVVPVGNRVKPAAFGVYPCVRVR